MFCLFGVGKYAYLLTSCAGLPVQRVHFEFNLSPAQFWLDSSFNFKLGRDSDLYDVMKAWIFKIHACSNKFNLKLMLEIIVMIVVSIQLSTTR